MLPEISTLHDRMARGGNWLDFREEISDLHERATSQDEFVVLMEAFANLQAVGPSSFDLETWSKIEQAANGEYQLFLLREASYGTQSINPILYDYITKREVESGRLDPTSEVRVHAAAGTDVLGDSSDLDDRPSRPGNWLAGGLAIGGVVLWFLGVRDPVSPLWLIPLGFFLGWIPNEIARKRVIRTAKLKRHERGYPI